MENRPASFHATHEEACRRVAALYPERWLHHYVARKLRADEVFRAAEELLRHSSAPLLDVGSGVGLLPFYLRERGYAPPITGLEVDGRKVRRAHRALQIRYRDVTLLEQDVREEMPAQRGNVVLFDILHYLAPAEQKALLCELAARVGPDGMLLIRDCPRDGSARFWITYAAELFAQRISWNLGVPLSFPTRQSIDAAFASEDFTRDERPMYGGGPFNNRLFIFRRKAPASADAETRNAGSEAVPAMG